ncbi:MAG TPA: SDR family NAD(P)-dependent oxidoreductase [Thermoanaerobaculia bacterium]
MTYFAGKAVVITGASSGIGAWLAREAARRGARVGLLARREERLAQLAAEIGEAGGRAAWASADVVDAGELERGLDRLAEELGGADVVVANAGYGRPEPPHKFKPGRALAMYDVNLFGMLRTVDWALPRFLDRRSGHLVGVASVASFLGMTNSASYCGSKAAMRVHLQSLRVSLAPYGVAVTTICPGFVESELTEKNKFRMPFIWETERAARKIADAIEKRRGEVVFPWQMKAFIGLATRVLPTALVERFMTPRKAKEPE